MSIDDIRKRASELVGLRAATDGAGTVVISDSDYDTRELARFTVAADDAEMIVRAINFAPAVWSELAQLSSDADPSPRIPRDVKVAPK